METFPADARRRERCDTCAASTVTAAIRTDRFVYLRCIQCGYVWCIQERRRTARAPEGPATSPGAEPQAS